MTDYVVEFLDSGEGPIGDQETFTDTELHKLLSLLARRVRDDLALIDDCQGLNIRAVDDSD